MAYKKSEETKNAILSAARKLFAEKGFYNTDIKEIAAELGMAHTAIYYYFKSKTDIASEIYDKVAFSIIKDVQEVREQGSFSPLFICILQYVLMIDRLALNPVTEDYFFDMINYRMYDKIQMQRVRTSYYAPLDNLFKSRGLNMSDDQMTIYILTSDAYAKALLSAINRKAVDYTITEALDHFFKHLLLPDLDITFEEYQMTRNQVFEYLKR